MMYFVIFNFTTNSPPTPSLSKRGGEGGEFNEIIEKKYFLDYKLRYPLVE
jgi:hypothetical protein